MSEDEADRRRRRANDASTHLLSRDIVVTSHGEQQVGKGHPPAMAILSNVGGGGDILQSRSSSLLPSNGSLRSPLDIQPSSSNNRKRLSIDGVLRTEDPSIDRASLFAHQSTNCRTKNYGTLHSPVRQKLSALRRLSFSEVVERITLTWENIDVYAPPARSKPIVLRGLCASSANVDSVQTKHILKDGKGHIQQD